MAGMRKTERAAHVHRRLEELYPETPIPLDHRDAYTLLVAVLLSAQCTDVRVNQVTPALFALAADPQTMMRVPVERIQAIIRPCGLSPRKAAAISGLSRILVEQHGGQVPADFAALEALPGVGPKTAACVLLFDLGMAAFPADTHVSRLCRRLGWVPEKMPPGEIQSIMEEALPSSRYMGAHLNLIEQGRHLCRARSPLCGDCPLRPYCAYGRGVA